MLSVGKLTWEFNWTDFEIQELESYQIKIYFKGVLHLLPQKAPKLASFVLYLKIIIIFFGKNIYIL